MTSVSSSSILLLTLKWPNPFSLCDTARADKSLTFVLENFIIIMMWRIGGVDLSWGIHG